MSSKNAHIYYHSDLCGSRAQSPTCLNYAEKKQSVRSKHLGSAAYLTSRGHVTQTLNYLPYGEDWIDVQNTLDPRLGQYPFHRERTRRGNRLRLLRRKIHGPRAYDDVAECRPNGGQVPEHLPLCLLCVEPHQVD